MTTYSSHLIKVLEFVLFLAPTTLGLLFVVSMSKDHLLHFDALVVNLAAFIALAALYWLSFNWKKLRVRTIPKIVLLGLLIGHVLFIFLINAGLGRHLKSMELVFILWVSGGSAVIYSWLLLLKIYINQIGFNKS
jgi:hypothetical protein